MPLLPETRAAEHADIPFEQDGDAPKRRVHDHSFVGADYPLDDRAARDALRPARQALLNRAGSLKLVPDSLVSTGNSLHFAIEVSNTGTGHNLPGGFAFVRQMWLEVTLLDGAGRSIASSGALASPADDLCDSSLVDDTQNPLRAFLKGCTASDPLLVNFQQMLLDVAQIKHGADGGPVLDRRGEALLERAPGGVETAIQHLTSGAIPRVRPFDHKPTQALSAGDAHAFPYSFALGAGGAPKGLRVRLLFRTNPPYFLRALGLAALTDNLEVTEMARLETALP
jgi:hypothetical protein